VTQTATQTAPQKQKGDRFEPVAFLGYLGKPLIYLEFLWWCEPQTAQLPF
jgi:hypothetical protein